MTFGQPVDLFGLPTGFAWVLRIQLLIYQHRRGQWAANGLLARTLLADLILKALKKSGLLGHLRSVGPAGEEEKLGSRQVMPSLTVAERDGCWQVAASWFSEGRLLPLLLIGASSGPA